MKKILAYIAVLIAGASAAFGQTTTWRVKDVEKEKVKADSGEHFEMRLTFINRGPSFGGNVESAYELTEKNGTRTLYVHSGRSSGINGFGSVESGIRVFLYVEGMDNPTLTGYAVRLTINGVQGIADEKAFKCASMAELIQRNAASRKVEASNSFKSLYEPVGRR